MGFIQKLVKTIFSPSVPQVQTPEISGRDLVEQTTSQEPNAPVMGGEKKKRKNINSLLVPTENIYKGGM